MKYQPLEKSRWWTVVVFAAAMAWVEAAVVYYLRTMVHRIQPYQPDPLPLIGGLGPVELVRELATLIMLLTVGFLAGKNRASRLGYTAIAFGVWDICYYVFLKKICGWPDSLLDWDILFLIPLPWWGPVLAPVCISLLMIVWGTVVNKRGEIDTIWKAAGGKLVLPALAGMLLALYTFMTDTLRVSGEGPEAVRKVLPEHFNWPLFLVALFAMSLPTLRLIRRPGFYKSTHGSAGSPAGDDRLEDSLPALAAKAPVAPAGAPAARAYAGSPTGVQSLSDSQASL